MEPTFILKKRKLTWFLLFTGFCCLFGWLATNFILMTYFTNSRHYADPTIAFQTLLMALACSSFFAFFGVPVFLWARRRLRRTERRKGLIVASLVPAALLTPLLGIAGMAVIILTPFAVAHARALAFGPKIVQTVDSPDGRYQAYVIDKPSIDGPNHHLYVRDRTSQNETFVTHLPEDVDYSRGIIWSPHSDIVVFRTHFKLIAYAPAVDQKQQVVLGGEYHWRKNGTFWVDYADVKKASDFEFPQTGVFSYRLDDTDEPSTLSF